MKTKKSYSYCVFETPSGLVYIEKVQIGLIILWRHKRNFSPPDLVATYDNLKDAIRVADECICRNEHFVMLSITELRKWRKLAPKKKKSS